ncbi:protein CPR-5-like isoform X2 [Salvia splendens]|uniref:protein CPR-5-like isoform X2 n=1 Tax=Salvia splendens TaxID=180675 RepID=UPI001C280690|nr:protein CPR-5-like isoform X2 [Salvia splendens]
MDSPLHRHATSPESCAASDPAVKNPPEASSSRTIDGPQSTARRKIKKKKKKKQTVVSDNASLDSSSNCSSAASHPKKGIKIPRYPKRIRVGPLTAGPKNVGLSDVDALGLPLGMSIAAVVAQICGLAVRESLGNVFGDKFNNFVTNFETSFRSTLMTLQLISDSSQDDGKKLRRARSAGCSCSVTSNMTCGKTYKGSARPPEATEEELCVRANITEQQQGSEYQGNTCEAGNLSSDCRIGDMSCLSNNGDVQAPFAHRTSTDGECHSHSEMNENEKMNMISQQLILHDKRTEQQLACASHRTSSVPDLNQFSMLSTIEKSVKEQTRSNDLKTFEIGLIMKKLQLKERQLELNSNSNILERWKLSMGISKASFKAEKFKTEMQGTSQVELLKKCLDLLVSGLIIMLFALAYGTYVYSHQRIVEATEACSPYMESKSWWMPNAVSSFNSGLQLVRCQVQVFSRMLFGVIMIAAIAFLLIQRSSSSHQTMPVTVILLLLGVGCGYAGKFCIDTLGGSGKHWLFYWEALCLLHFFSNTFHSTLYIILNGPIIVAERVNHNLVFPYWMRRSLFYATLLFLPLLCGFMPFASPSDWFKHFTSQAVDFLTFEED